MEKEIKENPLLVFFNGSYQYPTVDQLTGMEKDSMYSYINSVFCVGLANMLDNKSCYMIARYSVLDNFDYDGSFYLDRNDESLKPYFENIASLNDVPSGGWIHTDYGKFCNDDVIVVGESDECYYFVWLDRDVSDCCVAKVRKKHFSNIEEFNTCVVDWFEKDGFLITPIREPDGWIRW